MEKEIKWYAITKEFELLEMENPHGKHNLGFEIIYWFKKTKIGENTTSLGNTYTIYKYEFYDKEFVLTTITYKGWKIFDFKDPYGKNAYNYTYCSVMDPKGKSKSSNETHLSVSGDTGIVKVLRYIRDELLKYDSWDHYDLFEENKQLKYKLNDQRNKSKKDQSDIAALTTELNVFKEFIGEKLYNLIKEQKTT